MELRPGYKQSDVGVIPEDWEVAPLASVTPPNVKNGIVDGPFGSNLKTIHYRNSGIPIITSGYVTDGRFHADRYLYVDQAKFHEEKRSTVKPGDIVMAKIGERCGASAILPATHEIGILSGNALKITVDSQRHSTFYVWQVLWNLYFSGDVEQLKTVGAQPAISMANLKTHKIPLPPTKAEQEAIAVALSDADAVIESLDQLLAKKRQLKQGAMRELLTGKRRMPGFEMKRGYKQSEAGVIPEDWALRPFLSAVRIANGQVDPKVAPYRSMVLVAPDHIESGTGCLLKKETAAEQRAISGKYLFGRGDLVYSKIRPYLRKAILADFEGLCSADMYPLKPAADVSAGFILAAILGHHFSKYAESVSVRSGMPKINRAELAEYSMAFPPVKAEQEAIAETLNDMDAEIAALGANLAKARALKRGMMQELLTGRTRLI